MFRHATYLNLVFFTGHPLFQGVSLACPAVLLSFPACPSLIWALHFYRLASSNQCFAVRRRLTLMNADYWGEVARVVV